MEELIIRKANLDDLETLLRFEQGVINAERPFDSTLKTEDTSYYDLVEMMEANYIELVVAEVDKEIIGCGYARIENAKPYQKYTRYAYLGFMFVEPKYRGKGVNQKIIAALKTWVNLQKVTELHLEVYIDNISAIKAYEKLGFSKLMVKMRLGF